MKENTKTWRPKVTGLEGAEGFGTALDVLQVGDAWHLLIGCPYYDGIPRAEPGEEQKMLGAGRVILARTRDFQRFDCVSITHPNPRGAASVYLPTGDQFGRSACFSVSAADGTEYVVGAPNRDRDDAADGVWDNCGALCFFDSRLKLVQEVPLRDGSQSAYGSILRRLTGDVFISACPQYRTNDGLVELRNSSGIIDEIIGDRNERLGYAVDTDPRTNTVAVLSLRGGGFGQIFLYVVAGGRLNQLGPPIEFPRGQYAGGSVAVAYPWVAGTVSDYRGGGVYLWKATRRSEPPKIIPLQLPGICHLVRNDSGEAMLSVQQRHVPSDPLRSVLLFRAADPDIGLSNSQPARYGPAPLLGHCLAQCGDKLIMTAPAAQDGMGELLIYDTTG